MKISIGNNSKLGKRIASISREVGPTCPSSCPFLEHGCYAENLQRFRPSVRDSWSLNNMPTDLPTAITQLRRLYAQGKVLALRLHVGGDFLWHNKLDRSYLSQVLRLLRAVRIPAWVYTHAGPELGPHVKYLQRAGCQVFLSCHTVQDVHFAHSHGMRVAWQSRTPKHTAKRTPIAHKWHQASLSIGCPEQIGTKKSCGDCGYCFRSNPYGVVFYKH